MRTFLQKYKNYEITQETVKYTIFILFVRVLFMKFCKITSIQGFSLNETQLAKH